MAGAAPMAVKSLLQLGRAAVEPDRERLAKQIFTDLVPVMKSEDAQEGIASFLERREAVFKGR